MKQPADIGCMQNSMSVSDAQKAKRDSISAVHAQFRADFQERQEALKQRVDHCLGQLAGQPIDEADYRETLEAGSGLQLSMLLTTEPERLCSSYSIGITLDVCMRMCNMW